MNKLGKIVLITALGIFCVITTVFAPMAAFRHIDNLTMDQQLQIEAIDNEIEVLGDDIPLVENMHKILSDTSEQEQSTESSDFASMNTDMEQFLKNVAFPNEIGEAFARLNPSEMNQNGDVFRKNEKKTYSFLYISSQQSVIECQYTVEKETGKIIYFYAFLASSENETIDGREESFDRKKAMESYITYLNLDILGDWEYNGNRYHSKKAGFYVNAEYLPDQRYYSVGLEG